MEKHGNSFISQLPKETFNASSVKVHWGNKIKRLSENVFFVPNYIFSISFLVVPPHLYSMLILFLGK